MKKDRDKVRTAVQTSKQLYVAARKDVERASHRFVTHASRATDALDQWSSGLDRMQRAVWQIADAVYGEAFERGILR